MRLNGWQRMFVVGSVLSITAPIYASVRGANFVHGSYFKVLQGFEAPECKHVRELPPGYSLKKPPDHKSPCYELHNYKRWNVSGAQNLQEYRDTYREKWLDSFWMNFAFWAAVWAFGLLLLYGAGAIAAWVIRGFSSNEQAH